MRKGTRGGLPDLVDVQDLQRGGNSLEGEGGKGWLACALLAALVCIHTRLKGRAAAVHPGICFKDVLRHLLSGAPAFYVV